MTEPNCGYPAGISVGAGRERVGDLGGDGGRGGQGDEEAAGRAIRERGSDALRAPARPGDSMHHVVRSVALERVALSGVDGLDPGLVAWDL